MEEWKECSGFRNKYKVSSLGQVKSLSYRKTKIEQLLSQNLCGEYLAVAIDSKRNLVHRLIALAFIPNPNNYPEVDHINQNKLDNRVENLRWVTKSMNAINRKAKSSLSGYNHIRLTKEGTYRVDIRRKDEAYRKTFQTLEEAVEARDTFLAIQN